MNISIDCRVLDSGRRGGIGNYTRNLVDNLKALDRTADYFLFRNKPAASGNDNFHNLLTKVTTEAHPLSEIWENTVLPLRLAKKGIDVFHSPSIILPRVKAGAKYIITVHDLVAFRFPELFPLKYSFYVKTMTKLALKSADSIIAVSENTGKDIMETFGIPAGRIRVIHEGVDERFRPASRQEQEAVCRKYSINSPFILSVGTLEPRKNARRLISAYESIPGDYALVLAGGRGWLYEDILEAAANCKKEVIILENVGDADLPALYGAAGIFAYPALYEGFGLPVLEAMACGTPVITSNVSSLPEISGKAAVLVDPASTASISGAINSLVKSSSMREEYSEKGLLRAGLFSWRKMAEETLEVYRSLGE